MRHPVSVALCLLVFLLPAFAQRGGRGGGAAVVSRGGAASFHAAPRVSYSPRSQATGQNWGGSRNGSGGGHHRRYYSYGYYYPYTYLSYPYYGTGFYDNGSADQQDSDYYQQEQLNAEIGSLNQQMQNLRDENDSLRDYIAMRNGPTPTPAAPDRRVPQSLQQPVQDDAPVPATVLVFKDGHTAEVHNYAIVGNTLWALSGNRSMKYSLADIDIQKTIGENERHGVEFTAPAQQ